MPALLCVSLTGALILRLRMPPFALISSIAISAPSRKLVPDTAPLPDTSMTMGMLTVCCAWAAVAAPMTSAAAIQFAFISPSSLESLVLKNGKPHVLVGHVHQAALVHVAVGRLQDLRPVGPRIDHLGRIRRHVVGDF